MSLAATLEEIVTRIRNRNMTDSEVPLPYSDTIYKMMMSDIVESQDRLYYYLRILNEAHYIFILHITETDEIHNIKGLDGYVVAEETSIITSLEVSKKRLETVYEKEFRQRKTSNAIMHELFPQLSKYKNTPIGQAINSTMMLQQFLSIMKELPEKYTEAYKESKLNEIFPEVSETRHEPLIAATEVLDEEDLDNRMGSDQSQSAPVDNRRAIDTPEYLEIEKMDLSGKWGDIVQRYGVQFLIRIHLRKNEYNDLKKLIRTNRIAREADLRFIRDSIRTMESRMDVTSPLWRYRTELADLRRIAQLRMNQIFIERQKIEKG